MTGAGADTFVRVSEVFGPTLQGEGPNIGEPAIFVRLWGCNLDCSWCDTPYTWDTTGKLGVVYERDDESWETTVGGVLDSIRLRHSLWRRPLVVITGGEPLVQATALVELVGRLLSDGYRVEVETNGTRPVPDEWSGGLAGLAFNVSPKLAHAKTRGVNVDRLRAWATLPGATLKFVARTAADVDEAADLMAATDLEVYRPTVMPEGRTAAEVCATHRELAAAVIARGWRMTTRLHVLTWDDERGR